LRANRSTVISLRILVAVNTRRDTADGMVRIEAVLHPDEAAIVWAALDGVAKEKCRESQRVPGRW
jgi:hypothetical protein